MGHVTDERPKWCQQRDIMYHLELKLKSYEIKQILIYTRIYHISKFKGLEISKCVSIYVLVNNRQKLTWICHNDIIKFHLLV